MKMSSLRGAAAIVLMLAVFSSCTKKNPVTPSNSPLLGANRTSFAFRGGGDQARLILRNLGRGELSWTLSSKPDWLAAGKTAGLIAFTQDTVWLSTQTDSLAYGDYTGTLQITSDAGNLTLPLSLTHALPILKVWLPVLTFSREVFRNEVVVSNHGGNLLDWTIASKPDWIDVSRAAGRVADQPDTVRLTALLDGLSYQNHSGNVRFESNGGGSDVAVYLYFEREIQIFPDSSAARVTLGDTYGAILRLYGTPDRLVYDQVTRTTLHYWVDYSAKGLLFEYTVDHMLNELDPVGRITVESPYSGITAEGVGVGSLLLKVVNTYGPPVRIDTAEKLYVYQGISFGYDADSTFVRKIVIPG